MSIDHFKRRFLVACPTDDRAVGSLALDLADNIDKARFYRKHAKLTIREVDGDEMSRLICAGIKHLEEKLKGKQP